MIITVDGQSSSGKSSLACELAYKLDFHFLGSGSIYRLVAYAKSEGLDVNRYIEGLFEGLAYVLKDGEMRVFVLGEDLTARLQDAQITRLASEMAKDGGLRKRLLVLQKSFNKMPGLVAEGRDMGTVVFPEAEIKFFLVSDIEIRAKRRLAQLKEMGIVRNLEEEIKELKSRDTRDENRKLSPLITPNGATVIDTSHGTKKDNLQKMIDCVKLHSQ